MSPPQRTQQGLLHELQTQHRNMSHSVALQCPHMRNSDGLAPQALSMYGPNCARTFQGNPLSKDDVVQVAVRMHAARHAHTQKLAMRSS